MYEFLPKWLRLDWQQRSEFRGEYIAPVFEKYANVVQAKFYDAEAFDAEVSDFMVLNAADLKSYYFLMEELRETPLFAEEYIKIQKILIGLEDGHLEFEQTIKNREIVL
jgi:hypothetical protein